MKYNFGVNPSTRKPVTWDSDNVINGHMLLLGMSGAGKTFAIRKLVTCLQREAQINHHPLKTHIFDVHDDMNIDNESAVLFSEQSDYGMNPLIINADPDYGGVRKTIANFINTIKKTSHAIGVRQEAVLRKLLIELYTANGFYEDKPSSWKLNDGSKRRYPKQHPGLDDLKRFADFRLRKLYTGTDGRSAAALDKLSKEIVKLQKGIAKSADQDMARQEETLGKLKLSCTESYSDYVNSMQTGQELDELIKYQSKETLHSITDLLDRLISSGIFKKTPPPFDSGASTWRYRIKPLTEDERKMFTLFRLRQIFRQAMAEGEKDYIDTVIVVDECHIYLDNDEDNILNTISKEARKFGIMLIAALQNPKAVPDNFISSVATKVVLGIDELHWDSAVRKMKMTMKELEAIRLQNRIMVQIKNKGYQRAQFVWTDLIKGN